MTETKGLGVFAGEPIKKGSGVWRHVPGVYAVYDEHSFRAKIAGMSRDEVVHELTHVHGFEDFPGYLILALDDGVRINHSSYPKVVTNKANRVESGDDASPCQDLQKVAEALTDDRYSLVATRDVQIGEELANDYSTDDDGPAFYEALCEEYRVTWDFIDSP